jgi:hypothetical protein
MTHETHDVFEDGGENNGNTYRPLISIHITKKQFVDNCLNNQNEAFHYPSRCVSLRG